MAENSWLCNFWYHSTDTESPLALILFRNCPETNALKPMLVCNPYGRNPGSRFFTIKIDVGLSANLAVNMTVHVRQPIMDIILELQRFLSPQFDRNDITLVYRTTQLQMWKTAEESGLVEGDEVQAVIFEAWTLKVQIKQIASSALLIAIILSGDTTLRSTQARSRQYSKKEYRVASVNSRLAWSILTWSMMAKLQLMILLIWRWRVIWSNCGLAIYASRLRLLVVNFTSDRENGSVHLQESVTVLLAIYVSSTITLPTIGIARPGKSCTSTSYAILGTTIQ